MNKEVIKVSAEVKTFLSDLYSQIEYELQEQYKDEVQKLQQKINQLETNIDEAIEYIRERTEFNQYSAVYPSVLDAREVKKILAILERGKE